MFADHGYTDHGCFQPGLLLPALEPVVLTEEPFALKIAHAQDYDDLAMNGACMV